MRVLAFAAALVVTGLGLAAEVIHFVLGVESDLVEIFSLSYEGNVPTWYSSALLVGCASMLLAHGASAGQHGGKLARHWYGLAAVFVYISIDESVGFHERLNPLVDLHGFLYFGWILPVGAALVVLGLVYLPFLRQLPAAVRARFVLAGAIYVGGALAMEIPLGWWTERAGDHNLVYALMDFVEESMEILGATLFFVSLVDHLAERSPEVQLTDRA